MTWIRFTSSLLRARGGISGNIDLMDDGYDSSPRTRRYFPSSCNPSPASTLFSAHAEVFPSTPASASDSATLLRARGGISTLERLSDNAIPSSPRTRRYFPANAFGPDSLTLFSAHAEVFPSPPESPPATVSLLRARGGISQCRQVRRRSLRSSPRTAE